MRVFSVVATRLLLGAALPATFGGTWRVTGDDAAPSAIEAVVARMPIFQRAIARDQLLVVTKRCPYVRIREVDDALSIRCGSVRPPAVDVPDGEPTPWVDEHGRRFQLWIEIEGDRIVQTFRSSDGWRRNVYTVDDSGRTLTIDSSLHGPLLPEPVRFETVYLRSGLDDPS